MNEFERRFIEVTQNHLDLKAVVAGMGSRAEVEYFGYVARIGSAAAPLVAAQPRQAIIPIQSDAWFIWQYLHMGVVLPDGSTFGELSQVTDAGNVLVQITDTGSGSDLYSGPAPGGIIGGAPTAGGAGIPLVFPIPRAIPPNTNIKIEVTQLGLTLLTNPQPVAFWIMLNGARVAMV